MYFSKTPSIAKYFFKDIIWTAPIIIGERASGWVEGKEKIIYLTFDDGPTPEITEWTLNELKKFNAKATFFCIGKNIEQHPEILRKIISENHSVGNHTYDHLNGWKTKAKEYLQNVEKCNFVISNFLNPKLLFRPPYGKIRPSQYSNLKSQYSIIMWDVLSGDFDQNISGEKCFNNVVKNAKSGSIVVFHDSLKASKNLFYALPKTLEYFSEKGFGFEKVSTHEKICPS